ncbi:MAG: single-stranded DNA-binding protein [Minisyncoccia bacterium]
MNLNKAFILGNVTQDPIRKSLPSGMTVVNLGVATNRFYIDKTGQKNKETEFHNIVLFGKLAEIASQYLIKGSLVFIEGRIKTRTWEDQSGQKHIKTEIIGEKLQLGPKHSFQNNKTVPLSDKDIPIIEEEEPEINIDDIPF